MKQITAYEADFSVLGDMFFGAAASRLLMTALEFEVFGHLEKPHTAQELAEAVQSDPGNTKMMLDALCALGLLSKQAESYVNLPLSSDFLVREKPAYVGEWLEITQESWGSCLTSMPELIKNGPGKVDPASHMNSEEFCERFTDAHAATSLAGIGLQLAEQISSVPGFSRFRTMLDMGGGPGINLMAVMAENDDLMGVLFDRPEIVRLAQGYIKEYGFEERISVTGGDYLKDSLGSGYDLIMVTDSLYYEDRELDSVLAKCRRALNPGGTLVGIHAVLTDNGTKPENMVLAMLPEGLAGQGVLPEKGFFEDALKRTGYSAITSKTVTIGGALMEMNTGLNQA